VPGDDCVIATMPDWSGRIFFATQQGRVGTVDPDTGAVRTTQFPGESIVNSMAGDETGAIYLVTTHRLAAVAADGSGAPVVRWSTTYDRGSTTKPGQLSQGSGTTPTLIGDDVVAITDNAEPQMHVQFYRRSGASTGALICQAPVFAPGASATENSLAAADGTSVIAENNYGYRGVQTTLLGNTSSPGVAKVVLHEDGTCGVAWTSPVVAPTSVPKVSWGNGLLYVYAKPRSWLLDDSWYLTAIDVRTGETVWMQRTGNGIQWNNHYASIYLGPDGAAYVPTLAGLVRFADG
jgi:outer membrane protein assembly factor BamB